MKFKVAQVGNSLCLMLSKEAANKLKVVKGDEVFGIETEDGYRVSPYDPAFERQMDAARKVMKKRRNVLRELAK
ncbi:MAG: AbrB/MazE/SpoVT family DNA-binding domain-containing protein [Rhodospirillum sp.]|nr:AbrB/MazE/SpoVT family DNA-binding domain-containing protein [Rhodospirillum sp.]